MSFMDTLVTWAIKMQNDCDLAEIVLTDAVELDDEDGSYTVVGDEYTPESFAEEMWTALMDGNINRREVDDIINYFASKGYKIA